jgi:predicted ester cyclase
MSLERNKAVVRRLFEDAVNRRNLTVVDELINPTLVVAKGLPGGPDGVKALVGWLHNVFANLEYQVVEMIGEGDKVVARLSARGTHQGEYLGYSATGKSVAFDEVIIFRLDNGQIVELLIVADRVAILKQIGAISGA